MYPPLFLCGILPIRFPHNSKYVPPIVKSYSNESSLVVCISFVTSGHFIEYQDNLFYVSPMTRWHLLHTCASFLLLRSISIWFPNETSLLVIVLQSLLGVRTTLPVFLQLPDDIWLQPVCFQIHQLMLPRWGLLPDNCFRFLIGHWPSRKYLPPKGRCHPDDFTLSPF